MMLRRLPHCVSQNHGRCVLKFCSTLNDFIVWCLFCWRASWTENPQAWSISADVHFDFGEVFKVDAFISVSV